MIRHRAWLLGLIALVIEVISLLFSSVCSLIKCFWKCRQVGEGVTTVVKGQRVVPILELEYLVKEGGTWQDYVSVSRFCMGCTRFHFRCCSSSIYYQPMDSTRDIKRSENPERWIRVTNSSRLHIRPSIDQACKALGHQNYQCRTP